jgi:beta-galactosidase
VIFKPSNELIITYERASFSGCFIFLAPTLVKFEISGGKIIGVGNGDPSCHESDKRDERSLAYLLHG